MSSSVGVGGMSIGFGVLVGVTAGVQADNISNTRESIATLMVLRRDLYETLLCNILNLPLVYSLARYAASTLAWIFFSMDASSVAILSESINDNVILGLLTGCFIKRSTR